MSVRSLLLRPTQNRPVKSQVKTSRKSSSIVTLNHILSTILNCSISLFGNILNISCCHRHSQSSTGKQAIRIKPDYAEAHCILGVTYLMTGDKGSALEEYKILKTVNAELANKLFNMIYK